VRTEAEILDSATEEPPFSNGTELHGWMENWCWECHNPVEKAWQDYEDGKRKRPMKGYESGCPMIMAAMIGKTPAEWIPQGREKFGDQYHCIEYRGPDEGGGDPQPRPRRDPPGMEGLFERPERAVRMLRQPAPQKVLVRTASG
jgi:hypothetical protein